MAGGVSGGGMRVIGMLLVVGSLGCGSAPISAPAAATPALEPDHVVQPSVLPCLTVRDAELGCPKDCGNLAVALRNCASPRAHGRITVRWRRPSGSSVRFQAQSEGDQMERANACVDRVFSRFEPCHDGDAEGTLLLLIDPG